MGKACVDERISHVGRKGVSIGAKKPTFISDPAMPHYMKGLIWGNNLEWCSLCKGHTVIKIELFYEVFLAARVRCHSDW